MKTKHYLLAFSFLLLLGCSNDDDKNVVNGVDRSGNLLVTGASANAFLSPAQYNSLALEVVYVAGYRPSAQTLTNLRNFLEARCNKPGGVTITEREVNSSGMAPFDINEIAQLETAQRTQYNYNGMLTLYLYFADGGTTNDTSNSFTLGAAYRNTSFVMYEKTIQNLTSGAGAVNRTNLETTVILHEMGHLLGLTNLGSPMQTAHEDGAHPKHCTNEDCLMYWEVEGGNMLNMMINGNIRQLDANCLADLQANGGK